MEWIDGKPEGLFLPLLTDQLTGCEFVGDFVPFGEVVGHQERLQVLFELLMGLGVGAFDGCNFLALSRAP